MRELKLAANGLNSRRLAAGPDSGRLVLMLHGFPEGAESRERPARRTATGHEQGAGTRPGLVVSTDDFNNSGAGLVIVAPLTTSQRGYPSRIQVGSGESGLRETSWAQSNTSKAFL